MASLNLTADELKSLESVRSRLFQLSNSIGSLHQDVFRSNPLPSTYVSHTTYRNPPLSSALVALSCPQLTRLPPAPPSKPQPPSYSRTSPPS